MYKFDAEKTTNDIIEWLKQWEKENAVGCNFVVGISGGKDSSVVAALLVCAFGKNRVIGVKMPCGVQSDIKYSNLLIRYLGIKSYTMNIFEPVMGIIDQFPTDVEVSEQTKTNLPARIRMSTLYAISQSLNGRVANTCNLTETLLSWETRWGDAVGDFAPLANLTVEEVKAVGYVVKTRLSLSDDFDRLIEKVPSDGLCGVTDEDAMGILYSVADRYIRTGEIDDKVMKQKIDERVENYRFKRESIPYCETGLKKYIS